MNVCAGLGQPVPGGVEDRGGGMISAIFPIKGTPADFKDRRQWLAALEANIERRPGLDARVLNNLSPGIQLGTLKEHTSERVKLLREIVAETNQAFGDPDARRLEWLRAEQTKADAQTAKDDVAFEVVTEAFRHTDGP